MNSITELNKANRFFQKNSLKQDSVARLCCLCFLDLLLVGGWVYLLVRVVQDEEYWKNAPYPFYIFILVQYVLLALIIRVPIGTACRASTVSGVVCCLSLMIKINLVVGIYQMRALTDPEAEVKFQITQEYMVWGFILICVPASILIFLVIVVVKLFCFYIADRNQRKKSQRRYGMFEDENGKEQESDDPAATEAVVGVYFRAMEKVVYDTITNDIAGDLVQNHDDSKINSYMAQQKQCRLCLQYFYQGENLMKIPICDHIFHGECLKKWLMEWQKCPSCDRNIIHVPEGQKDKYITKKESFQVQDASQVVDSIKV